MHCISPNRFAHLISLLSKYATISIRGGGQQQLNSHHHLLPSARSNIAYAYGHLKEDKDASGTNEQVTNVKSNPSTMTKWSDNEFEEEDHFFHALYHNDDKVVTNVSTNNKKKTMDDEEDYSEDEFMFAKLHNKLFHRRGGGHHNIDNEEATTTTNVVRKNDFENVFQDIIEECSFFE